MNNIQQIPLSQLRISPRNARKTGGQSIADLAASIAAEGLLQNLVVTAANDGSYEVEAGGRRLRALQQLNGEGTLPAALTDGIPCNVVGADVAGEASLAENAIREAMHPADQFDAFLALVDSGRPISEAAARFGVSELFVKQRLRLARVKPEFLEMYRADEIGLDQLQALAITDNHEIQRQAWHTAREWERRPDYLRRFITRERVESSSALATFVGLDAYQAAGGEAVQDLFSSQCWLADPKLLDKLALDKLSAKAEALREAGWSWVDPVLTMDRAALNEYRALEAPEGATTLYADPAHEGRLDQVIARIDAIEDTDADELDDDEQAALSDELAELEQEREEILSEAVVDWPASIKAIAGAIVTVGSDGHFDLYLGRLQPGQKVSKSGAVSGASSPALLEPKKPAKKPELSDAMRTVLSAHRSAAAAAALAHDHELAHCVLLEQMLIAHWPNSYNSNGLHLSFGRDNAPALKAAGGADIHQALRKTISDAQTIIKQVPRNGTLAFLLEQPESWRRELQTALVIAHFDGITASDKGHAGVDAIHRLTGFDMSSHWTPSVDDFIGRIHGDLLVQAVTEAKGKAEASTLTGLKKADRIAQGGKLLAGTGWLPKPLRGADYGKKAAADVAKASKPPRAAKKKPAKKVAKKPPLKKAVKGPAKKKATKP